MEEETLKTGINSTGESHVQIMGKAGQRGAFTAMLSKPVARFVTPHYCTLRWDTLWKGAPQELSVIDS